jgi:hypothetical protein
LTRLEEHRPHSTGTSCRRSEEPRCEPACLPRIR